MKRTVKIAVVGSGLAGLTAAYRIASAEQLGDVQFEVHLFEKTSSIGMDSHSVSVEIPGYGEGYRVDVPMRSFQGGYYPQLIALYTHLGVRFRQADFTYSFSSLSPDAAAGRNAYKQSIRTTMTYNGQSGTKGVGMPTSLHPLAAPGYFPYSVAAWAWAYAGFYISTFFVLMFYLRLVMFSLPLRVTAQRTTSTSSRGRRFSFLLELITPFIPSRPMVDTTLRAWTIMTTPNSPLARFLSLDTRWHDFVQDVVVPLFSAVCTCGEDFVWELPMEEVLDYIYLTFGTHHYVVSNGVRDVAQRMSSHIHPSRIHLGTPIVSLVYSYITGDSPPAVDIHCLGGKVYEGFSHVIMATQANHASRLLQSYLDTVPQKMERHKTAVSRMVASLSAIKYCKTVVVNHTDASLVPPDVRDRRDLNLVTSTRPSPLHSRSVDGEEESDGLCVPSTYTMATHVLPPPPLTSQHHTHTPIPIYQTTNPIVAPREDSVLSVARLERAVVTLSGKRAVRDFWRSSVDAGQECEEKFDGAFQFMIKWGCSATARGVLGPLQGAGALCSPPTISPLRTEGFYASKVPGIWICGSYAHSGIPLLEGCVVSARNVVEQGIWVAEGVDASSSGW